MEIIHLIVIVIVQLKQIPSAKAPIMTIGGEHVSPPLLLTPKTENKKANLLDPCRIVRVSPSPR